MGQKTNHGEIVSRTRNLFVCWDGGSHFEVWLTDNGVTLKMLYEFNDDSIADVQAARVKGQEWINSFGPSTDVLLKAGML